MQRIRALIHRHRAAALWLVALALLVKALVPTGYMVGQSGTRTFDISFTNDMELHSRTNFQWFISSVEVRIAP